MPLLGKEQAMDEAKQLWHAAFKGALLRRTSADQLALPLKQLSVEHAIPGEHIANALLGLRAGQGSIDDPLLFHYAQELLDRRHIGCADLLLGLLRHSTFGKKNGSGGGTSDGDRQFGLPSCEERFFTLLVQSYISNGLSLGSREVHRTLYALVRWLRSAHQYETGRQMNAAGLQLPTHDAATCGMYDALGSLALTILSKPEIRMASKQSWWKQRRPSIVQGMLNYDIHVLQWVQSQLSGRLQALTRMPPFAESDEAGRPVISGQQVLESVPEVAVAQSRAGLYVWLNACLCGRPLTDDAAILGYLQARYNGDNQTVALQLIIASFDVLYNACVRRESDARIKVAQSFLCNKVPLLLAMLGAFIAPLTTEACIEMACTQIIVDAPDPVEANAATMREKLVRARLDFLQACALHHLVSEPAISRIVQEPVTLPKIPRLSKDSLVSQCNNNIGQLENYMKYLSGMQGNAGAVAGCIAEVINGLCMNKDTMSLKNLCGILAKHVKELDIVILHVQPVAILQLLCGVLDNWVHDPDSELTSGYEEFASILLVALVIIFRYDITRAEVGFAGTNNFVFDLLQSSSVSYPPNDLSDQQSSQLAKWCEGFFAVDESGDTTGIDDDVMKQCPPQDFYRLVPTLFEQSVLACKSGTLSLETFKSGIELAREPFLLPSLIGGLSWLAEHSWEDHGDVDILLQLLEKLLEPRSNTAPEIQAMQGIVLDMVAVPLVRSLQDLLKKRPEKTAARGLIDLLRPHIGGRRTWHPTAAEVHEWAATPGGGLLRRVRNSVRELVSWASSSLQNPPPVYTHKLYLAAGQLLGPEIVLSALAAEIQEHMAIGQGPQALDVCVALICAPVVSPPNGKVSVKDHLRLVISDATRLLEVPVAHAEALVRLSRRVEAQLAVPQMGQLPFPLPAQEQSTDQIMQELGLGDDTMTGEGATSGSLGQPADMGQVPASDFSNPDLGSALGAPIDFNPNSGQPAASEQNAMGSDENFFGDLNMGMDASGQQMQFDTGNAPNDGNNNQQQDDDIFADIMGDMGNMGEDFNF